ncbi:hypothetical protein CVT24_008260 [Panaeolus cyanescens]|uniref:F-box domain-containing protein n=1 Tax=Panaeolus cyanescens TaxID=181874 RepID=A0A409VF92_9AGAR|nr:hypothetical protein CVT24_008260 [Panaeolus cyanescens]
MFPPCMSNFAHRAQALKQKLLGPADTSQDSTPGSFTPPFDRVPHAKYHQGNDVPTPDEQKDLRAFIRRASDHQSWLRYQMDDLIYKEAGESTEKLRETLQQEISQLHDRISEAQTILSPVRRLTYDALQEIFLWRLWDSVNMWHTNQPTDTFATKSRCILQDVLTLSHVCMFWRSIALSTPALWSYLPPHYCSNHETTTDSDHRDALSLFQMLLKRSQASGLTLSLYLPNHYVRSVYSSEAGVATNTVDEDAFVDPVFSCLVDHSERWANVSLANVDLSSSGDIPTLFKLKGRLPKLARLRLYTVYSHWLLANPSISSISRFIDLFADTPTLQSLAYRDTYSISLPALPGIQRLTSLEIPINSTEDVRLIAFCADTLKTLIIPASNLSEVPWQESMDPTGNLAVYEFPCLTTLGVTCSIGRTFLFLKLPLLEDLTWHSTNYILIFNHIYDMFARSSGTLPGIFKSHPLKKLCITTSGHGFPAFITPDQEYEDRVLALFRMIPHLLMLHIPCPTPKIIRALATSDDAGQTLPELEFCLFDLSHKKFTPDLDDVDDLMRAFNDFTSSRCELSSIMTDPEHQLEGGHSGVRRLKSFQTVFDARHDQDLHERILRPLVPGTIRKPSKFLASLLAVLAQDLPGAFADPWDPWYPIDKPVWHKDRYLWRSRLVRTFFQIGALDLDVWTIFTSGWHTCLERLRTLMLTNNGFYQAHNFLYEFVRDMHEGCMRKFDENPWTQRWLLAPALPDGCAALHYVPTDHPLMSTSHALDIVYDRGQNCECEAVKKISSPLFKHQDSMKCTNYAANGLIF